MIGKSHVEVDTIHRIHACVIFQFLTIQIWECLTPWLSWWWSRGEPRLWVYNRVVHVKMKTRHWSLLLCSKVTKKITVVLSRKALWRLQSVSSTLLSLTWKSKTASWHQIWQNYIVMKQHIKAAAVASASCLFLMYTEGWWGSLKAEKYEMLRESRKIWNAKRNVWYLFRIF